MGSRRARCCLAARMDLGRLIRFNTERHTTVADVRGYVGGLRGHARDGVVAIAPAWAGEDEPGAPAMGERERVLLSIAERAGAVELEPGARGGLQVRLTGRGDPRKAYAAIKAAKDRGWESYRAIERFISNGERCRRRQILDHFGDQEAGAPSGRCCDVCEADAELAAAAARGAESPRRRASAGRTGARGRSAAGSPIAGRLSVATPAAPQEPVDETQFDTLRAWRLGRAEGKPAFTVASNAVLEALLRERPTSREGLLAIRGIGPAFCEKHGDSLLEVLAEMTSASRLGAKDAALPAAP